MDIIRQPLAACVQETELSNRSINKNIKKFALSVKAKGGRDAVIIEDFKNGKATNYLKMLLKPLLKPLKTSNKLKIWQKSSYQTTTYPAKNADTSQLPWK